MTWAWSVILSSSAYAEPGVGEDLGPLRERQVGSQDYRRLLGTLRHHLEQKLSSHLGQRHVADLIDGDYIVAGPPGQDPPELQLLLGLHQFVYQVSRGGEAYPPLLPAGRDAKPGEQVGLARARVTDEHHGLGSLDVATFCQHGDIRR